MSEAFLSNLDEVLTAEQSEAWMSAAWLVLFQRTPA